jgi:hypothetical protein
MVGPCLKKLLIGTIRRKYDEPLTSLVSWRGNVGRRGSLGIPGIFPVVPAANPAPFSPSTPAKEDSEMARFDSIGGPAAPFGPHLEPGEQIRNVAFGVKQPHMLLIVGLLLLAVIPGAIAVALMTKEYLVALTDRRIIALRIKGRKAQVLEVIDYRLASLPPARTSTGPIFTHIAISDPARPFAAKFHRAGPAPSNRDNAMAIAAALAGPAPATNAMSLQTS